MDNAQSGASMGRGLIQKVADVDYLLLSFSVLLRCAWYGSSDDYVYPRMVSGWDAGGGLLYMPLDMIKMYSDWSICRLTSTMAVDPVVTLIAFVQLTEIGSVALENQKQLL